MYVHRVSYLYWSLYHIQNQIRKVPAPQCLHHHIHENISTDERITRGTDGLHIQFINKKMIPWQASEYRILKKN